MGEPLKLEIEERVQLLLPNWAHWSNGVVLVSKKEWNASENRIRSILQQLHRSKKQMIELRKKGRTE